MIETVQLKRQFGELTAVDGVSIRVPDGVLTGFVGANGAGKTTTLRMITGTLEPTSGQVLWDGAPITAPTRRGFGYMPEERGLYPKQPVLDQLTYLARLRGASASAARAGALSLLERFGLAERAGERVERLSLGNQQRVQIIAAVMSDPIALILDEPFSGLDPNAVDAMADLVREYAIAGLPVFFSSHQLDLVDRLCDRLVIMARGRVVAQGTTAELRAGFPTRYRLTCGTDAGWVRSIPGLSVIDVHGADAVLEFDDEALGQRVLGEAMQRGPVREFARIVPSLSELYREVAA